MSETGSPELKAWASMYLWVPEFGAEVALWSLRYWWFAQGRGRLGYVSGRRRSVPLYDLDIGRRQARQKARGYKDTQRQDQFGTDHTTERSLSPIYQIQPADR